MTILSTVSSMVIIACSVPFRHMSCQTKSRFTKVSRRPLRAGYVHFLTRFASRLEIWIPQFGIPPCWTGGHPKGAWTLCATYLLSCSPIRIKKINTLLCMTLHVVTPWYQVVLGVIVELRNRACSNPFCWAVLIFRSQFSCLFHVRAASIPSVLGR